jgi:glycosyltransferase involved in cell wall biosynthesis
MERGRYRAQRNGMQLLRAASESKQIRRLRPLLDSLMSSHRAVVFHAHTATVAFKIVRAFGHNSDERRWRLLITDHSKGGALSEYIELLGPSAIHDWNYRLVARQTKLAVEAADVVAFPSQGARELWQNRNSELAKAILAKSAILYNGVARPKDGNWKPPEDSHVKLFAIAQHVPEKGLDRLIAAVAGLRGILTGRRISLRIAGGFTRVTPELDALRARLGLENQVAFLGRINHDDVLQEIAEADIFVAFPRVVVFDLALLEAMALGKPIVTNALRGNIEALGKTYPLFANDETEFAEKIARCSTDSALSHRAARRNKRRYERLFTSDAMARRHCDLYSALTREILS